MTMRIKTNTPQRCLATNIKEKQTELETENKYRGR